MADLKPCPNPFCSKTGRLIIFWDLYRRHVKCMECGIVGPGSDRLPPVMHGNYGGWFDDAVDRDAQAVEAWNTRAIDDTLRTISEATSLAAAQRAAVAALRGE